MQKSIPLVGDAVRVRRRRWRVADTRPYGDCALITLRADGASPADRAARVLVPFDDIEPIAGCVKPRVVGARRWRAAWRSLYAASGPADTLRAARTARIELMPHQLEPVLAITRGLASRLLIADDVGLGKTIEAGLIVSELLARGAAERVIVLTPAGLREQWLSELSSRFQLPFALIDMREVNRRRAQLPPSVNPWSTEPLVVASVDYAKRAEIFPAVHACRWDVVVVDEAHGMCAGDRHRAVAALCESAAYVVLLTATPHSGDTASFDALRALGCLSDELLVFRRARSDVGFAIDRRVHQLHVAATSDERRMVATLDRFAAAVRAEHRATADAAELALSVLRKRACSSAFALEQTVRRRLASLASDAPGTGEQLVLRFDDPAGEHDADEDPEWTCPALKDPARERSLLVQLADAARLARAGESKLRALQRLLRRVREPAIVFTEYRDTLRYLHETVAPDAAIIHGGLSRNERRAALDEFARQRARLLLATDAAGEGLNLHHSCHTVISFELPWNPMRLEQRIGRVDRIGQTRRVHAFHLVAHGLGERHVLQRLDTRVACAAADLSVGEPARVDPSAELSRLLNARRLCATAAASSERSATLVRFSRRRAVRRVIGRDALVIARSSLLDAAGRSLASHLTALRVHLAEHGRRESTRVVEMVIDAIGRTDLSRDAAFVEWVKASNAAHERFWTARALRERAICDAVRASQPGAVQAHLFDRRSDREQPCALESYADLVGRAEQRIDAARRAARVTLTTTPALILLS